MSLGRKSVVNLLCNLVATDADDDALSYQASSSNGGVVTVSPAMWTEYTDV